MSNLLPPWSNDNDDSKYKTHCYLCDSSHEGDECRSKEEE